MGWKPGRYVDCAAGVGIGVDVGVDEDAEEDRDIGGKGDELAILDGDRAGSGVPRPEEGDIIIEDDVEVEVAVELEDGVVVDGGGDEYVRACAGTEALSESERGGVCGWAWT